MANRIHHIAATVALTVLTAAQAFAGTLGTTTFTSQTPQLQITACFTRYFVTPTSSFTQARYCSPGEKAGTIKVVYVG